jgi:hypothetical protein
MPVFAAGAGRLQLPAGERAWLAGAVEQLDKVGVEGAARFAAVTVELGDANGAGAFRSLGSGGSVGTPREEDSGDAE